MSLNWHRIDLTTVRDPRLWELADAAAALWRRARHQAARTTGGDVGSAWVVTAAAAGRLLFQAVQAAGRDVLAGRGAMETEPLPAAAGEVGNLPAYHLQVPPALLDLPWSWLHTGVSFLRERAVLSVGPAPLGGDERIAPWQRRRRDLQLLRRAGDDPEAVLRSGLGETWSPPEILALTHDPAAPRTERELAAIADALQAAPGGRRLARLVTAPPGLPAAVLARRLGAHHGLHYTGPVASDPVPALVLAPVPGDSRPLEPVGVDPVTALLDDTARRVAEGRRTPEPGDAVGPVPADGGWELPDGRLLPEALPAGSRPPLVVSNGHCHLPRLGPRWLAAGCQVVVAPQVPVPERTAEHFAAAFYRRLGRGVCAAAACHGAVGELLRSGDVGGLGYGLLGDGCFSLLYL